MKKRVHTEENIPLFNKFFHIHWWLVLMITVISCIGFVMMHSAANGDFDQWGMPQAKRFAAFFVAMLIIAIINIKYILRYAYVAYGGAFILLVLVEVHGTTIMGATRWISLGGFTLQPSELMKICLVLALARYFHIQHYKDIGNIPQLIPPLLMVLFPFVLVLKQPDLGTALILLMTGGAVFFAAGIRMWKFAVVGVASIASIPIAWHYLHDYQKQRILTFLNPESDPQGAGYNILQSQIAIGSGGFSGKGFMGGSQNQLSFLPEKHTDFIFTMLSEEFGFVGSMTVLVLYAITMAYGILISMNSRNHFGRLLAIGVTTVFFLHIFINIAMVMGMIPVVGAPLPLLSYGGTMMMTMLVGFGFVLNVHIHRDKRMNHNLYELR